MAIDHLVFNKLKWFNVADNADDVQANGKKYYAVPSKITIKQGTSLTYPIRGSDDATITNQLKKDLQVDCVGANANHYFFVAYIGDSDTYGIHYGFDETNGAGVGEVLKSNCKNIVW